MSMQKPEHSSSPIQPEKRTRMLVLVTLIFVLAGLIWTAWWFWRGQYWIETNDAYVSGNITPVNDQTAGTISRVLVENTEFVRAGQVMATLQANHSQLALQRAGAHLAATVRMVRKDFAKVTTLQQTVSAKNAELHKLNADLIRYKQSLPSGAVSAIRVEDTQNEIAAATAQVAAARAALQGTQAITAGTTLQTNPLVRQAVAQFEQADIQWQRRVVRAPVSGYVAERATYPGLMVHPGQRLFSVVPLNDLWVVANVKETAMRHVHPGQSVQLTSYYYGGDVHYHGIVLGVLPGAGSAFSILPPEDASGNYIHIVERVPVRIALPAAELAQHPLRPGLSMVAEIHWTPSQKHSVLKALTTTPARGYQTAIYDKELWHARQRATAIIRDNAWVGGDASKA
ncbi:efflux RND transporter periplasmic adaptor subunit [Acidithiobacillus sp.]|uniref:efflux RND transporter periplasmic adaptor subunit n=1 Tax=Acidithiobacillus sp. TaxID=1872118 RepID=UPI002629410D|nr:efflux RND transporter periplasmic adaptor subunit [Acidithiobacillus sp.]